MNKLLCTLAVFFAAALSLLAVDAKNLRIATGSLVVEEVPFKIEDISISSKDIVKVENHLRRRTHCPPERS